MESLDKIYLGHGGRDQVQLWKVGSVAPNIAREERNAGHQSMGANKKIRQRAGARAANGAITLKRFGSHEKSLTGHRQVGNAEFHNDDVYLLNR
jgi:hypothetical protein